MDISIIGFTAAGQHTALDIARVLRGDGGGEHCRVFLKKQGLEPEQGVERVGGSLREWTGARFEDSDALVFVGAAGIAVRAIAPFIVSKRTDPAVLVTDERGTWVISLLSGHLGGANALTERVAAGIGAVSVITTATDVNGRFAVDVFAKENGLAITDMAAAKGISAAVLDGERIGLRSELPVKGELPAELYMVPDGTKKAETDASRPAAGWQIRVGIHRSAAAEGRTLWLVPQCLVLGVGCRRGKETAALVSFVREMLEREGICPEAVAAVASIDRKADEPAIRELAEFFGVPFVTFSAEQLMALVGDFASSAFVRAQVGADNVCERSAVLGAAADGAPGRLVIGRQARDGMTVAAAVRHRELYF